jgi:hypothetical protein
MADEKPTTDHNDDATAEIHVATGSDKAIDPSADRVTPKAANARNSSGIVAQLKADGQAYDLAVKHGGMELINRLKAFYERIYGVVHEDLVDWHWIATNLKNHTVNHVIENPETGNETTNTPPDQSTAAATSAVTADSADATGRAPPYPAALPLVDTDIARAKEAAATKTSESVDTTKP